MAVNIIVLAKQVPDPEAPPSSFEVNPEEKRVIAHGLPPVINPFDENALEAAIRIEEEQGGTITLLSLGKGLSRAVFLKAVASGADRLFLVEANEFDACLLDSNASANLLAQAIRKIGGYDLILSGRQASDTNAGQVGLGVSQLLGIPAVSVAQKVNVSNGRATVEKVLSDGYEVVDVPLPCLVTVSGEIGDLRYPSLQAIKAAKSIPQTVLTSSDLEVDASGLGLVETVALAAPSRQRSCAIIEGKTPEEAGERLAQRLKEDKII
jgi:electron transfer flavoprotein beta subunit